MREDQLQRENQDIFAAKMDVGPAKRSAPTGSSRLPHLSRPQFHSHELCLLDIREDPGTTGTGPQKTEVHAEEEVANLFTNQLCGSTLETHPSLWLDPHGRVPWASRPCVPSSLQDSQTLNCSRRFFPDVQPSQICQLR